MVYCQSLYSGYRWERRKHLDGKIRWTKIRIPQQTLFEKEKNNEKENNITSRN